MAYESVEELIGNTPLVKIDQDIHGLENIELYAKLEYYNPFGSLKDRVAYNMVKPELEEIKKEDKTVLEASSGNTAKAMSTISSMHGLEFKTITNRIKYPAVRKILKTLGTDIEELPGLSDCPDPNDPDNFHSQAQDIAEKNPEEYFHPDQYFNELNWKAHYEGTAKEIHNDIGAVDYVIGTLGTAGSTYGLGKFMKEKNHGSKTIGVVSEPGEVVPGGRSRKEMWEVGIFDKDFYDKIVSGSTKEAIEGMKTLSRKSGILGGPTTGLNFKAGLEVLKQEDKQLEDGEKKKAVFIACDRMEWYTEFIEKHSPETLKQRTKKGLTLSDISEEQIEQAPNLSPEKVKNKIESDEPIVLDIRGNFAYKTGHIPTAINILDKTLTEIIEQGEPFPENKEIIVTCAIGENSKKYVSFLQQKGYQAYSIENGIQAWKEEGFELEEQ